MEIMHALVILLLSGVLLVGLIGVVYLPYAAIRETLYEAVHLRQMARLQRDRPGETREQFVQALVARGVPERIAQMGGRFVAEDLARMRDFPVRPEDSLADIYRVGRPGGRPLTGVLHDCAERCGLYLAPGASEAAPPATVQDLIGLIAALYRESERDGAARMLLRPATPAETLLRPAQGAGEADAQRLLRPAAPSEAADGATTTPEKTEQAFLYERRSE